MTKDLQQYFHLHLVSDATGETLSNVAKAVAVQYSKVHPIEHTHPLIRTKRQLSRVFREIEAAPGIVLYTIVNRSLADNLEEHCQVLNVPCLEILRSIMKVFESYLGSPSTPTVGGQHLLGPDYFRRIDALNFTMVHDDGQMADELEEADIVLIGISRTSKTPTSIYLANRGYKTANVPLVSQQPLPYQLETVNKAFVVGLVAAPEHIAQVRRSRMLMLADRELKDYVDHDSISAEIAYTRRLCAKHRWPVIEVTRRSIEETAAAVLKLYRDRQSELA